MLKGYKIYIENNNNKNLLNLKHLNWILTLFMKKDNESATTKRKN